MIYTSDSDQSEVDLSQKRSECERWSLECELRLI